MKNSRGFTITELSFAMAGLSVLMIILITSAMAMVGIYNKGLVLKAANQSGRALGDELQKSIRQGDRVKVRMDTINTNLPIALCTGKVSYVWSARHKQESLSKIFNYATPAGEPQVPIGIAKVSDPAGQVCSDTFGIEGNIIQREYGATADVDQLIGTELLAENLSLRFSGNQAAIDGLVITQTAGGELTTFVYTIGSLSGEDYIDDGTACKGGAAGEFCALNTFMVSAYARYGR
jgi:hypothetical protein